MKKAEIPSNEDTRLQALTELNILDTSSEDRFHRFTRLAKRTFNVQIALVSLVDKDRRLIKSANGAGICDNEIPREDSFCGHAILEDKPLIICDTSKDERFHDNPLVTNEPKVLFYAGYPLKTANGEKVGTLCIIDNKPREFGPEDIETLEDLGSMVERELSIIQLASEDELTGISNRRGFQILAQQNLNFCMRYRYDVSLVYFDLNKFKQINDKFGHAEGDKVLIKFAERLKNTLRDSDIYGRTGGDEFVALLCSANHEIASKIIERFENYFSAYNRNSGNKYDIVFSYGIVEYDPQKHKGVEDMMKEGDQLMYEHKQHSNNVININTAKLISNL